MKLIQLLRSHFGPYRRQLAAVIVLMSLQTAGSLYLPNLNADIINNGVITGNLHYIVKTGGYMIVITLALGILAIMGVYWASKVSMGVGADLRAQVFTSVQTFSAQEMSNFGTPSLITRNTNDIQQIQLFLQIALPIMIMAPILCVGGIIMALTESAKLSLLLVAAVPVMLAVVGVMLVLVVPSFRTMQVKIDRINLVLREQINGVRVIRAFVRNHFERVRFSDANESLTATSLRVNRIFAFALPVVMLILNLSSVAVLWFGGRLVSEGELPIGNLIAFLTYIMLILMGVMMAVMMFVLVPRAMVSAERITEVVTTSAKIADPVTPVVPTSLSGRVELRNVTFGYPGSERPVLHELTFTVRPGEVSAIIGGTGSGKTTLLNLIPRFLDATSGTVLVNDVDVRDQSLEGLWGSMGLVPQASYLFSGTVADNLRYGRADASDEELWRALSIAQADSFVADMPGGLDAPIDQGGTNVSGGQRQRLSIARALVAKPRLYLLDDCFSSLDAATDARLRTALEENIHDAAVVIVSQRVSTIMHAAHIIVLDEGSVVGQGTHDELVVDCSAYAEIVTSQLGEGAST